MNLSTFPDINVWLALSFRGHVHHVAANAWFESLTVRNELIFARLTQLGLLRLLTNAVVMGNRVKTQREAWLIYDQLLASERVRLMHEPLDAEESFRKLANLDSASPRDWTDSYLAAFAEAAGLRVVTFDKALAAKAKGAIWLRP